MRMREGNRTGERRTFLFPFVLSVARHNRAESKGASARLKFGLRRAGLTSCTLLRHKTDAAYPARWLLRIPAEGIVAVIIPKPANQENTSALIPNLYNWEGSVWIESPKGRRIGHGYVELTGSGGDSRPPI